MALNEPQRIPQQYGPDIIITPDFGKPDKTDAEREAERRANEMSYEEAERMVGGPDAMNWLLSKDLIGRVFITVRGWGRRETRTMHRSDVEKGIAKICELYAGIQKAR